MSDITEYFANGGLDHQFRTPKDILKWDDNRWEATHDFIQWAFPLHEKSYHNINSPVLTPDDIEFLRNSAEAKANMIAIYDRFNRFLGLGNHEDKNRQKWWAHIGNHNLLRITRAIRSLRLFGLDSLAQELYENLQDVHNDFPLPDKTWEYWDNALNQEIDESMTRKFLDERRIDL